MYSRAVVAGGLVAIACSMTGCREDEIRSAYASEFKCPEDGVTVEELGLRRYRVAGCDRTVVYQCVGDACAPDREDTPAAEAPVVAPPAEVAKRERRNGRTLVALNLHLDKRDSLRLSAAP